MANWTAISKISCRRDSSALIDVNHDSDAAAFQQKQIDEATACVSASSPHQKNAQSTGGL
jgi:hypothetical protein